MFRKHQFRHEKTLQISAILYHRFLKCPHYLEQKCTRNAEMLLKVGQICGKLTNFGEKRGLSENFFCQKFPRIKLVNSRLFSCLHQFCLPIFVLLLAQAACVLQLWLRMEVKLAIVFIDSFFFFSLYVYCFSPTLGIVRKLIFCLLSYFGITKRNKNKNEYF